MRRLLMAAYRAGHIVSPGPPGFWVTEFSWDSKPPDPYAVPAVLEARWVAEALHNMWRWGVGLVTWFLIRDVENSVLQSGLYFNGGPDPRNPDWPKPALTAFRFPFVAYRQGPSVAVWGRTPTNAPGRVTIEVRSLYGWRRVAFVRANVGGIFSARLSGARIAERLNEPVLPLVYPRVVLADTPRSYWRLEEKRGTVAHDQMGVTNGTYEGGVSGLKLGIPGALIGARDKAVRFLGGGRVSLGPVSVPSTVEFWAKTKSRNDQPAVSFRDSFHHSLILNLHGELPRAFDYGASLPGYTRVNGGAWHQIVYTFKAGRARLYVDGRLEHVQPWPREEDVNDSFLGYDASTRSNLDGSLDEVAIYDHALTGGQVAYHYVASGRRPLDFRFLRARMRGTRDASWPFSLVRRPDFFVNPFGGI